MGGGKNKREGGRKERKKVKDGIVALTEEEKERLDQYQELWLPFLARVFVEIKMEQTIQAQKAVIITTDNKESL